MKNFNVMFLVNWLSALKLDIQRSSARRRVVRLLSLYKSDFDLEVDEVKKKYADKTPEGEMKIIKEIIQFSLENRKKADAEIKKLNELVVEIDWSGEEKDKAVITDLIKDTLKELKTHKDFTSQDYEIVALLEEIIEELKDKPKKK